jgi:hypothetical protein
MDGILFALFWLPHTSKYLQPPNTSKKNGEMYYNYSSLLAQPSSILMYQRRVRFGWSRPKSSMRRASPSTWERWRRSFVDGQEVPSSLASTLLLLLGEPGRIVSSGWRSFRCPQKMIKNDTMMGEIYGNIGES